MNGPEGNNEERKIPWDNEETQKLWEEIQNMRDDNSSGLLKLVDFMKRPDVAEERKKFTRMQLERIFDPIESEPTEECVLAEVEKIIRGDRNV